MLNEEVKRYRELSGDNNPHTPISRIGGYLDGYEKAMEQKTGHWIPVSERLPGKTGRYLITYCYQDKIETQEAVYVEGEENKWYDITDIEITLAVIAWMPLPEPYKAEKE